MIYRLEQFHFNNYNKPTLNNNILKNNMAVVQLGIQAPAGTRFLINNLNGAIFTDIEIGVTQIFELDLKDANTAITQLSFTHLQEPDDPSEPWNILVDCLYES